MQAVLFDLDGTLVETNIDFSLMKREMIALAGNYGIPVSELHDLDILGIVDYIVDRLNERSLNADARAAHRAAFEKLEQIELVHSADAKIIAGAAAVLRTIGCTTMKVGIVTRNCRNAVRLSLERTGITADVLVTRDDVANTKPHPDHIMRALEALSVQSANAVTIGDHIMDIRGGKAAGTRTIGFLRPSRPDDFFDDEHPDLVIRNLEELLPYIEMAAEV